MGLERHTSPAAVVALSLVGAGAQYASACILAILNRFGTRSHMGHRSAVWLIVPWLLPCVLGVWAMLSGQRALERGIAADIWPATVLCSLRLRLRSGTVTVVASSAALFGGVLIFTDLFSRWSHLVHGVPLGVFSVLLISPLTTLTRLKKIIAEPKPLASVRWDQDLKPIASAHWGESDSARPS